MNLQANTPVELLAVTETVVGLTAIFRSPVAVLQAHQAAVTRNFQFLVNGEVIAYDFAIFFHDKYLEEMSGESVEFVIQHELGHIVHNHDFTATDFKVIISQECEADTYAMLESRIGFMNVIKTLLTNHHRMIMMNAWSKQEMHLLNAEIGYRVMNVIKSIPALIKSEFTRAKQTQISA